MCHSGRFCRAEIPVFRRRVVLSLRRRDQRVLRYGDSEPLALRCRLSAESDAERCARHAGASAARARALGDGLREGSAPAPPQGHRGQAAENDHAESSAISDKRPSMARRCTEQIKSSCTPAQSQRARFAVGATCGRLRRII